MRYTSTPITNNSGIWDIYVADYSQLLYLGGATEEITIADWATAVLKGGRIDAITSMQYVGWLGGRFWGDPHVSIYCQPGWSWISSGSNKVGITGLWRDNTPFSIQLINDPDYPPTWMNINVVEIPEPASLALVAFSGLLIRRKK